MKVVRMVALLEAGLADERDELSAVETVDQWVAEMAAEMAAWSG